MTPRNASPVQRSAVWAVMAMMAVPLLASADEAKKPAEKHGGRQAAKSGPQTPAETVASFTVAPGLKATLWASEPDLVKPTNIDIDSRGRIWITEAANYRSSKTRPEGDRILILEDTKHTGVCDSAKVFVQDKALYAPLGICVLGNKVIVSQSPNMLVYTMDETGDKPVGPPQTIFTGFGGTNHDHGLHAALFGPDGRIYFNCGNEGDHGAYVKFGNAFSQHDGKPVVDITGSEIGMASKIVRGHERAKGEGWREGLAFSMGVDGSDFEVLGYNFRNNYELTVDSYGSVWQSDNDDDGNQGTRINYVMEGGNFGYTGPLGHSWGRDRDEFKAVFPDQTKPEVHWHLRWPGVVPNLLNTGQGSPCGITVYEGDLLPELYQGALFHCDAGPNVVRAYITRPGTDGAHEIFKPVSADEATTFKNEPAKGAGYQAVAVEVIKGGDRWFRPDGVCVAPDGAVYVSDWYDPGVGGHQTGDTGTAKHGNDWHLMHGRVYRITPENYTPPAAAPTLDLETVPGQIAALNSPNFATRYLGYTKLVAEVNTNPAVPEALKHEYETATKPWLRARSLWLLARSTKDGQAAIEAALKDKDGNIRVAAFRAARRVGLDPTQYADEILADSSPAMLRELCLALQFNSSEKVLPLLVKLADKYDGADRWYLEAFGIACNGREKAVLDAWEKSHANKDPKNNEGISWRLKLEPVPLPTAAAGSKEAHASANGGAYPFADDNGVAAHDANLGVDLQPAVVDSKAACMGAGGVGSALADAEFAGWASLPIDRDVSQDSPGAFFMLVAHAPSKVILRYSEGSTSLATPAGSFGVPQDDRYANVTPHQTEKCSNGRADSPDRRGNSLRSPACGALFGERNMSASSREKRLASEAAKRGCDADSAASTAPAATQPALPAKEFKTKTGEILPSMDQLAQLTGDPVAGAAVFRNAQGANCIKCHQIGDDGNMIGPPLNVIGSKLTKAQIYEAIFYPSAAIEMGYETWVVRTKDGDVFSGLKTEDTPDHITIKDTDGKYHDVDRDKIDRLVKQPISLMPEGLMETITKADLLNLVEYLSGLKG